MTFGPVPPDTERVPSRSMDTRSSSCSVGMYNPENEDDPQQDYYPAYQVARCINLGGKCRMFLQFDGGFDFGNTGLINHHFWFIWLCEHSEYLDDHSGEPCLCDRVVRVLPLPCFPAIGSPAAASCF